MRKGPFTVREMHDTIIQSQTTFSIHTILSSIYKTLNVNMDGIHIHN